MLKTKEHVLYYFSKGSIKLSHYDNRFVSNLSSIIRDNHQITSNQQQLFEKIILKYRRQLAKNNLDATELAKLPWNTEIVLSDAEHTSAKLSIEGNELIIRVPFNRKFINYFRTSFEPNHEFEWDKNNKVYRAGFNTVSLKMAVEILPDFFSVVYFCPKVSEILEQVNSYPITSIWQPTLVKLNGNFFVLAAPEVLMEAIEHIELNDDPKTIYELSLYGISTHDNVIQDDLLRLFASDFDPIVDLDELPVATQWMKQLGMENTVLFVRDRKIKNELETELNKSNIYFTDNSREIPEDKSCVFICYGLRLLNKIYIDNRKGMAGVTKNIIITNSRPVEIA